MDFSLTERQRFFQEKIRAFASSAIDPVASELDRQEICPSPDIRRTRILERVSRRALLPRRARYPRRPYNCVRVSPRRSAALDLFQRVWVITCSILRRSIASRCGSMSFRGRRPSTRRSRQDSRWPIGQRADRASCWPHSARGDPSDRPLRLQRVKTSRVPRQRWHSWHPWQCALCNLQNLKGDRETESLSLRQLTSSRRQEHAFSCHRRASDLRRLSGSRDSLRSPGACARRDAFLFST
jgi:hypothetical protein